MRLSELIGRLEALRREHGDCEVVVGDGDNVLSFTAVAVGVTEADDCGASAVLIDLTESSCEVLSGPLADAGQRPCDACRVAGFVVPTVGCVRCGA